MSAGALVVVGAGHAGGRLCRELLDRGYAGVIDLIGEEPLPPYERPPLSKDALAGVVDPGAAAILDPRRNAPNLTLRLGRRATRIAPRERGVALDDGALVRYDRLVLATGLRPRPLPLDALPATGVHVLRTAADACRLRAALHAHRGRLIVVGGGFVGLEVAATARTMGWRVTVVERAARCLERLLPARSADQIVAHHVREGVDVRCNESIAAIEGEQGVRAVRLANGERLAAELVVVGIGSHPNDDLARAAGLDTDGGIQVDAECRTSDPAIYAIGDVAAHPNRWFDRRLRVESWDNAELQATRLASHLLGEAAGVEHVPWFWTDQFGINVQVVGVPRDQHALVTHAPGGRSVAHLYFHAGALAGAVLFDAGRWRRSVTAAVLERRWLDVGTLR